MKYTPLKYKDILALFNNTSELEVVNDGMYTESIKHTPTGWYFYTTTANFISVFFNRETGGEVDCSVWQAMWGDLITKPAQKIQKALYEDKITK